ncbi:TRAM1-like protein [Penicillium odoratum]|uniref:TRAM1-like protein n=1 Tax=Penicillium odoratum TaxID=1167516 RepID=UPI0025497B1A|nr:TRAM1-like protein [Penicillium odoratum]KAJ5745496.1 TRAM1-like protein [Penicillium odoratum]
MTKETPPSELNVYVSSRNGRGPRAKETTFREWVVNNQIGISMTILAMLLALHNLYPSLRPYTQPFFQLSYYNPSGDYYVQGWDDVYFVISAALALTAVRAFAIEWVLQPLACRAGLKRKGSVRFAEQGWQAMYYGAIWAVGLYLWKNSYYWFDFGAIWAEWPARPLSGLMKWYLLVELAFLVQQIFVIHVEERRKDHYQMLSHHIITSTLLSSAYIYGFYNVSNVVLCLMDVVDFLLPSAKILKYLKFENACNVAFGVFMSVWFVTRHVLYNMLWWSIYKNVPSQMSYGCYSGVTSEMISDNGYPNAFAYLFAPFRGLENPICMNRTIKWIFLSFLLSLQGLSIVWFTMIVRVAYGVVVTGNAEDTRSDEEDEVELDGEALPNGSARLAAQDGANTTPVVSDSAPGLDRRRSNGTASLRARGRGRVPFDQSDRKALLGRIGCEKPT